MTASATLHLLRHTTVGKADDRLCIGKLTFTWRGEEAYFATGELPLRLDKRKKTILSQSQITAGTYPLKHERNASRLEKYEVEWGHEFLLELTRTGHRSEIQIHTGNFAAHTEGCILIGDGMHYHPKPMVSSSTKAYRRFMARYLRAYKAGEHPTHITIDNLDAILCKN